MRTPHNWERIEEVNGRTDMNGWHCYRCGIFKFIDVESGDVFIHTCMKHYSFGYGMENDTDEKLHLDCDLCIIAEIQNL